MYWHIDLYNIIVYMPWNDGNSWKNANMMILPRLVESTAYTENPDFSNGLLSTKNVII